MMKYLSKIQYLCLMIGTSIWLYGWFGSRFNVMAVGMLLLFIQNILFSIRKIKYSIVFLMFQIAFFTFLLARPVIGVFKQIKWWTVNSQTEENVKVTVLMVTLSLVALFVGATLAVKLLDIFTKNKKGIKIQNGERIKALRFVALGVYVISLFFFLIQEWEKVQFIKNHTYLEYYSVFRSDLPGIIHLLSGFMTYSLCLYLSTFPSKKQSLLPLLLYGGSAIPALIVGVRNPIILNCMFIFLYYFIRDTLNDKEKWIGKFEKIVLIVSIPCVLIFMFAYSYIRSNQSINITNPLSMIEGFFWAQGTTFSFISQGYGHRLNLPIHEWGNYTFGGILDYFYYGRVGRVVFGTEPLPVGNNLTNALESHNLSHNLSYVILRDRYLNGQGVGSSYVFENYLDWGYIGIISFSLVLGGFLILFVYLLKKNTLIRTIVLVCLTSIFFAPRAEATGWLNFIVSLRFWVCIAFCYLGAYMCNKITLLQKIIPKRI